MPLKMPWHPPTSDVLHEPISATIGLTWLLTTVGFGAATAATIGGSLVTMAAAFGASKLASMIFQPTATETPSDSAANPQEIHFNERQSAPPKRIIYGTAKVGGALFFEAVRGTHPTNNPRNLLYQGVMICAEPITAFKKVWIGTNELPLPVYSPNIILTPLGVSYVGVFGKESSFEGNLSLCVRLGLPSQTKDPILADFTNLAASFRQQGIATAVLKYFYGVDQNAFIKQWGQVQRPNPFFLVEGVAVPDPRNPTHRISWDPHDPVDLAAARATWAFSNNASLCQTHYLTQRYGGRIHPSRIDWDKVAIAANYDDEVIACRDGTFIKKHTIDGVVTLNQRPSDVMMGMLSANRGFVLEGNGKVWPSSSIPKDPITTIHDGILVGGLQYRAARPKRDLINKIRSRFHASERLYQETDGPILSREDLQAFDGELLEVSLALPFSMDHRRVQRLAKAALSNARLGRTISCAIDISLLSVATEELIGNVLTFDSTIFPQCNGNYLVVLVSFSSTFAALQLSLVEYDKTIETDWNYLVDEQEFTLAELNTT